MRTVIAVAVLAITTAAPAAPPKAGARADFLKRYKTIQDKLLSLVELMDDEQLRWRPGPGVRSLEEALVHVTTTHYRLASFMGAKVPAGIDLAALEKTRGKKAILTAARTSYSHVREHLARLSDADLGRPAKVWGRPSTVRFAVILAVAHSAEHLGQAIAYARMQGLVPPWSRKKR